MTVFNEGAPGLYANSDGQKGVVVTTNTSPVVGNFSKITILADANFSALTEKNASGQAMTGFVIPAGLTLFGDFTGYTLASGKVRAYV